MFTVIVVQGCFAAPPGGYAAYNVTFSGVPLVRRGESLPVGVERYVGGRFYGWVRVVNYSSLEDVGVCFFGFRGGQVRLRVVGGGDGFSLVNVSLVLRGFRVLCPVGGGGGRLFSRLGGSGGRVEVGGVDYEYFVWDVFVLSRVLRVDGATGGVVDAESGEELGEWVFWLSRADLASNETLLLVERLGVEFMSGGGGRWGLATLALVNSSWAGPRGYRVGGVEVPRARTVMGVVVPLPGAREVYVNVSDPAFIEGLRSAVGVNPCRALRVFGNGTYVVEDRCVGSVYRAVAGHKPWRLGLYRLGVLRRGGVRVYGYVYYVEEGGWRGLLHPVFDPYMFVYDRGSGLLLEQGYTVSPMGVRVEGFEGHVPCVFSGCFSFGRGLGLEFVFASERPVGLVLVDTDMLGGVSVVEGGGGGPVEAYVFVVAAVLVAAFAVALWRWRR